MPPPRSRIERVAISPIRRADLHGSAVCDSQRAHAELAGLDYRLVCAAQHPPCAARPALAARAHALRLRLPSRRPRPRQPPSAALVSASFLAPLRFVLTACGGARSLLRLAHVLGSPLQLARSAVLWAWGEWTSSSRACGSRRCASAGRAETFPPASSAGGHGAAGRRRRRRPPRARGPRPARRRAPARRVACAPASAAAPADRAGGGSTFALAARARSREWISHDPGVAAGRAAAPPARPMLATSRRRCGRRSTCLRRGDQADRRRERARCCRLQGGEGAADARHRRPARRHRGPPAGDPPAARAARRGAAHARAREPARRRACAARQPPRRRARSAACPPAAPPPTASARRAGSAASADSGESDRVPGSPFRPTWAR